LIEEKTLSTEQVFQGRAVRLRVDTVEKPSGTITTREIVEHSDCIAVVAVDNEDRVLLVRQFRKPVEEEILEIPAGGIEPGETPAQAVRRELQEETGLFPDSLEELGGFYSAPGYCTEYLHLYLATDLISRPLEAEDTHEIELVKVPIGEVPALINSGGIRDAKSIAGLLRFLWREHR
jgi:ADP-ribose pyrophosphatase